MRVLYRLATKRPHDECEARDEKRLPVARFAFVHRQSRYRVFWSEAPCWLTARTVNVRDDVEPAGAAVRRLPSEAWWGMESFRDRTGVCTPPARSAKWPILRRPRAPEVPPSGHPIRSRGAAVPPFCDARTTSWTADDAPKCPALLAWTDVVFSDDITLTNCCQWRCKKGSRKVRLGTRVRSAGPPA